MPTIRIVGAGRAGRSLATALDRAGWTVLPLLGRGDDVSVAADGVDAVVLAVPDDAIAPVAARIRRCPSTAVVHLAGSLGPGVLAPHARRAALHPLVAMPDPEIGAARLASGVTFAVAGDPFAHEIAAALGGTVVDVPDADRAAYHAAAAVASNHVMAVLGQVERIAGAVGLPLDAFLPLARAAVEDAGRLGPRQALTGPAARGDWTTLDRHLAAIDEAERPGYRAGVGLALALRVASAPTTAPDDAADQAIDDTPDEAADAREGAPGDALPAAAPAARR